MRLMWVIVALIAFVSFAASPSLAADNGRIGLSRDGVTWTSSLTAPLFAPDFRWVPGDVQISTFYVRNQSGESAQLSVDVLGSTVDDLIATGEITIAARVDGGRWIDVSTPGQHRLVRWVAADPDAVRQVDVRVRFRPGATNQSQLLSLDLAFRAALRQSVTMEQPRSSPLAAVDHQPQLNGILPSTGAPAFWTGFAGLSLLIAGLIVAFSRREEEEHSHVS